MRRIVLFLLTNLAVMALLTIVVKVFGIDTYTYSKAGINFKGLLVMSAVLGFGGSFVSLLISKMVAKWQTGARVIENPSSPTESWLLSTVRRQAEGAGERERGRQRQCRPAGVGHRGQQRQQQRGLDQGHAGHGPAQPLQRGGRRRLRGRGIGRRRHLNSLGAVLRAPWHCGAAGGGAAGS